MRTDGRVVPGTLLRALGISLPIMVLIPVILLVLLLRGCPAVS
jgi:hypothetical protein